MSMAMALLSCAPGEYHVNGRGTTKLRPGGMSMDMALLNCAPGVGVSLYDVNCYTFLKGQKRLGEYG